MYVKVKNSTAAPTSADIAEGELAIDADNKVYTKNSSGDVSLLLSHTNVYSTDNLLPTTLANQFYADGWSYTLNRNVTLSTHPSLVGHIPQLELIEVATGLPTLYSLMFRRLSASKLAVVDYRGIITVSQDNGDTWNTYNAGVDTDTSGIFYFDPYYYITTSILNNPAKTYYSSDLINWYNPTFAISSFMNFGDVVKTSTGRLVSMPPLQINTARSYYSDNNGVNWLGLSIVTANVYCMAVSLGAATETIIALYNGGIHYSTNNGNSLNTVAIDANFTNFCACIWTGTEFLALKQNSNSLYHSSDGISWTLETLPKSEYWSSMSYSTVDQTLLLCTYEKPYMLLKSNGVWYVFKHPDISNYMTTSPYNYNNNRGRVSDYHDIFLSNSGRLYTLKNSTTYGILPDLTTYNYKQIKK